MRRFIPLVCLALLGACDGSAQRDKGHTPYVKAHEIKDLMATVMEPQAQVFWKSAGVVIDAAGERNLLPTTEAGWLATRSAAATVTEMGNLLMTPLYAEGRGDDWAQFAKSLVEVGQMAEKAAVDRDEAAIFEVGETMYNVCAACHQVYPPAETLNVETPASSSRPK